MAENAKRLTSLQAQYMLDKSQRSNGSEGICHVWQGGRVGGGTQQVACCRSPVGWTTWTPPSLRLDRALILHLVAEHETFIRSILKTLNTKGKRYK